MEQMLKQNDDKTLVFIDNASIGFGAKSNQKLLHHHLTLSLQAGEFTCVLGHNGAGKTTLLKTMAGLIKPLDGTIWLNHKPLHSYTSRQLSRVVTIVLTERSHSQDMTVRELVATGRMPYTGFFGRLSKLDWEIVDQALETIGISALQSKALHAISDGERQKAMIAKALTQETPIILLDEPTAFLDLSGRVELMEYLQKLAHNTGKTILITTHDVEQALQFADNLWLLARNKPVSTGMPEDLIINQQFASFFESDGLRFDSNSGLFKVQKPNRGIVQVNGSGVEHQWLVRALNRYGYQVEKECDAKIDIHRNGHTEYQLVAPNGQKMVAQDIEQVLHSIQNWQ